jgi:hypothetical protein
MNPVKIKYHLLFLLIIIFIACNSSGNKTVVPADSLQLPANGGSDKIILPVSKKGDILDTLNELSFVQEANRNLDSITHHRSSIAYIIDTTSDKYHITAGYNGAERFETYFIFSVDKNTRAIKVEDVISGELLSIEAFEKSRKAKQ